jgi:hypothetical protein
VRGNLFGTFDIDVCYDGHRTGPGEFLTQGPAEAPPVIIATFLFDSFISKPPAFGNFHFMVVLSNTHLLLSRVLLHMAVIRVP